MNQLLGNHHAYIVLGNIEQSKIFLQEMFGEQLYIYHQFELLGTEEVKKIRSEYNEKTSTGKQVVVSAERISIESQNALLKLIEEPVPGMVFYFLFPPHMQLLPTVLSRVRVVRTPAEYSRLIFSVKDFLKKDHKGRLEMIETLSKSKERKDNPFQSYEVQEFLDAVESGFSILFHKKPSIGYADSFAAIRQARTWSAQTGFPQKNVLDYLAISVITI
jgi:hypothetical protein